jgi:hypothetical protein
MRHGRRRAVELQRGEPELETAGDRTKEAEARRRISAVAVIGPEHVAGHRDRLDPAGLQVFLDEIAVDERALELVEELDRLRGIRSESGIEAAFGGILPDKRPKHGQMTDMGGCKHVCKPRDGSRRCL